MIHQETLYKVKTFKEYRDILNIEDIYFDNYDLAIEEATGILNRYAEELNLEKPRVIVDSKFIILKYNIGREDITGPVLWIDRVDNRIWRSK